MKHYMSLLLFTAKTGNSGQRSQWWTKTALCTQKKKHGYLLTTVKQDWRVKRIL